MFFIILLIILGAFLYFVLKSYNTLQGQAQFIKSSLSNISVSLQKKVNLINQLIDIVKNYQEGEQLVHLTVSKDATRTNDIVAGQRDAQVALMGIQGFSQRYPDLKANEQYQSLMHSIKSIEDEISKQREIFNHHVRQYNTTRGSIPTIFIANALKFSEAPYLDFSIENMEQNLLKNFNTDSSEHLNALLSSAKNNLVDGSKSIANKALETSKRIIDSEQVQNLKDNAVAKYQEITDKNAHTTAKSSEQVTPNVTEGNIPSIDTTLSTTESDSTLQNNNKE